MALLMMGHGVLGIIAELMGIYLILRMRTQWLPARLRVRNFKRFMRLTLGLWTAIVVLGLGIYYFRYLGQSTPVAVVVEDTPTPPPPPTATTAPRPTLPPSPTAVPARGVLTFANDKGLNDKATVKLSNVPPAAAGKIYQAWFASSNVALVASAGEVKVATDGTATIEYIAPDAANLVALYDQFFITIESAAATKPSATMVFSGQIAARLSGEVKNLLGSASDTPDKVGYAVGLHDQSDHLLIHAAELRSALDRGNLAAIKRHAEHLINLLEGKKGAEYGDSDKDGQIEDPGDGFGMMGYIEQIGLHAQAAASAPDATDALKQRAAEIQIEVANMKKWAAVILKDSLTAVGAQNVESVRASIAEADANARFLVRGQDKNASGKIEPVADEAGFQQMYPAVQELAGLALTPLQFAQAQNLPTATPPPSPTATPIPQPKSVTVLMKDFAFKDKAITIDKGTTVVWVNKDPAKHTVTADVKGTVDSKDIAVNGQFSFTFNTPGTFAYYCEYHGDRGGVDMAGTVVVK
ncbi:MAG: anti-sigma factor [Chloroflexi bacterium]|nr:anti-sigma factor [Chloroflexota bacterium]